MLIKHCYLMGKTPITAEAWLKKCYPDSCPGKSTIKDWFQKFRFGRTDTDDAKRSGRPNEAVTAENIKKIVEIVKKDRKVKVRELADIVKISRERVGFILHEHLGMKKLCARWVPRFLSDEQKKHRVELSERNLELLKRNPVDFFRRLVTMDETWIHHYTPESNRQSAEWLEAGESRPKRPRTQQSAGKVLASIFWDAKGIIFIDYLEKGKTINSEYYMSLLTRLKEEIAAKRPHMNKKKLLFHHDNAPAHASKVTTQKLNELKFELLPHPPYSPDLAPSDYWLFPNLKRWLQGKRFSSNEEVLAETEAYFEELDSSSYMKGLKMLEDRYTKCITLEGNYVED